MPTTNQTESVCAALEAARVLVRLYTLTPAELTEGEKTQRDSQAAIDALFGILPQGLEASAGVELEALPEHIRGRAVASHALTVLEEWAKFHDHQDRYSRANLLRNLADLRTFDYAGQAARIRAENPATPAASGPEPGTVEAPAPEAPQPQAVEAVPAVKAGARKAASVNARMVDLLKDPSTHIWSAQEFATKLGCGKSTVAETEAWKTLRTSREMARQERAAAKQEEWQRKAKKPNVRRSRPND
jgi:hypothetical protein